MSAPSGSFQCTYFRHDHNRNVLRSQTKYSKHGQHGYWNTRLDCLVSRLHRCCSTIWLADTHFENCKFTFFWNFLEICWFYGSWFTHHNMISLFCCVKVQNMWEQQSNVFLLQHIIIIIIIIILMKKRGLTGWTSYTLDFIWWEKILRKFKSNFKIMGHYRHEDILKWFSIL